MTPSILLDKPGPFELGATLTGRVVDVQDAPSSFEIRAQGIAKGVGAAAHAEQRATHASTGEWKENGRFSCRINGSDQASRTGALFHVNWTISLVRTSNGEVVASLPIETRVPPPEEAPPAKPPEVMGYRQSKHVAPPPDLAERAQLTKESGLGQSMGCLLGAIAFTVAMGLLAHEVIWGDSSADTEFMGVVVIVGFLLISIVLVFVALLGLRDAVRRKRTDVALAPVVDVSSTHLRRGEPLHIDICCTPKRPLDVKATVTLRKIEIASTGAGSDFQQWQHPTIVEKKTAQKKLGPGESHLPFLFKIPEDEELTGTLVRYSVVWDVLVAVEAQDLPAWDNKFEIQVLG
ncbi:MAG TPA: hypothetical protein PK156_11310 [Polyangium sp.]|nr:hypothetical protein [Polyangium sp.]